MTLEEKRALVEPMHEPISLRRQCELLGLGRYFAFYNCERPHQALGYSTPAEVYGADRISVLF